MFKAEDQAEENKKSETPENNKEQIADGNDTATNEDTEKGHTYMGKIKIIF